ncbi:MAG TPA: putative maltokinase, partial [Thermoanaerobaculia bacterium]|nr:putative maltokinase [Thermoanaerobaculia bacterium]
NGRFVGEKTEMLAQLDGSRTPVRRIAAEQSNTSIIFGDRLILKLFRKVEPGLNPDLEIGRFLTQEGRFPHTPSVAGSLAFEPHGRRKGDEPRTVGILQQYAMNEGDAWSYTLDSVGRFYERVLARSAEGGVPPAPVPRDTPVTLAGELRERPSGSEEPPPGLDPGLLGTYLDSARTLGHRTAEMHLALASDTASADFAPEPFGTLYQRSLYQSMRSLTGRSLQLLEDRRDRLADSEAEAAERLLAGRDGVLERFGGLLGGKLDAQRIRIHGDYHLGQVLYTGRDFLIIDFEGEPARALSERRIKRSPLRDVAGMLRSFDYAAHAELRRQREGGLVSEEEAAELAGWAAHWQRWVSATFLAAYLDRLGWGGGEGELLPGGADELALLLDVYLLEKALYELRYELNNRPGWVGIPLAGILQLVEGAA